MLQLQLINRIKTISLEDVNISSLLMYGSFAKGEGDEFSDIEFYIFYHKDFNHQEWVNKICETLLFFTNEFGTEVAIFENMIRGEFHFLPTKEVHIIKSWEGFVSFEYYKEMMLVDKENLLANVFDSIDKNRPKHSSANSINWICMSLLNNLLMTKGLIERRELAHAQQSFQYIQKYLLYLIRIKVGADNHWESPTKKIEIEIPIEWYDVYAKSVPSLRESSLKTSFNHCIDVLCTQFKDFFTQNNFLEIILKIGKLK